MRKLFLMAAAAVLTLGSCSNDKEVGDVDTKNKGGEIGFRTLIDKGTATRATVTTSENILGFTVTGWWDKTDDGTAKITAPTTNAGYLFNAYDITRREAGMDEWDYDPKLYWPAKGSGVDFYAYSPASSKNVTKGIYNYAGAPIEYTVPDPGEDESQEDFMMALTKVAKDNKNGAVTLNFAHVLSRATFSAKKTNPNITYIIRSVELVNIKKTGTLDLDGDPEAGTPVPSPIPADGKFTYSTSYTPTDQLTYWDSSTGALSNIGIDLGDSPVYVENEFKSVLGPTNALMVMPQTTTYATDPKEDATGFMIKVSYKAFIDVNDPGTYYAGSKGDGLETYKTAYFAVKDPMRSTTANGNVPFTFEIGRQYNFYLTFGHEAGGPISFEVKVGEWNNDIPNIELKNYWFEGLISANIAKGINSNYEKYGVTQAQLDACTDLIIADVDTDADMKGLELVKNLTTLTVKMKLSTSKVSLIDTKPLEKLTKITLGGAIDATIETLDISSGTVTAMHAGANVNYNTYGQTKISKLIVKPGYTTLQQWKDATSITSTSSNLTNKSSFLVGEIFSGDTPLGTKVTLIGQ
ncbi:fimbrillin family protein [Alistipes sp. OttesenSCG-928-B03]|nr:fimbrillin family protein [Alistipes sp. OttesenSCG-928-B03]